MSFIFMSNYYIEKYQVIKDYTEKFQDEINNYDDIIVIAAKLKEYLNSIIDICQLNKPKKVTDFIV